MKKEEIERLPEVKDAARVLRYLEDLHGLREPIIASGWTRAFLTDTSSPDIDVSYVGGVRHEVARESLKAILFDLGIENCALWDVEGIWDANEAYGVESSVEHMLRYYVDSIDSVYLASDGLLHDPTGHGFKDAEERILRINDYDEINSLPVAKREEVNICLEGCRRIAQLGWSPTDYSVNRIELGAQVWSALNDGEIAYFTNKLSRKYPTKDSRTGARQTYAQYNWGFIFDLI